VSAMADHPPIGAPWAAVAGARRPCFRLPGGRRTGPVRAVRAPTVCFLRLSTGKMAGLVRRLPTGRQAGQSQLAMSPAYVVE
jgi:hypothetical protein